MKEEVREGREGVVVVWSGKVVMGMKSAERSDIYGTPWWW